MLLNVHDKDLKIIGILDNESQDTIGYSEDKWTRELKTGSSVYEFTAFNRKLSYETVYTNPFNCLNVGNYVSFNYDGEDHVFKIMSVEKTGTETYCYCENLNLELRNEMVGAYDSGKEVLTIEKHISNMHLLDATNIVIGLNELSNIGKTVSFTNEETKLSRLLALFKEFGAEHKFTTKLNSNGTVKEFRVDIYKKRESDGTGGVGRFVKDKILRKGENIKSLKEKQDILEIFNMTVPKGIKKVTRVTQEKKPTVNSNEVVVSSNMINSNGTLSIENIQTILKLCYEYRILPSGVISQLYLESFWGNSNVARVDNNWSGMTWTGNPNRPSGVVVSQGSARPSSEGGYYMHFANMSDFFKDYFYLLAKQGIYNVANKNNISDYTKGLFRVGGAAYDYAAAGYDHYNNLMNGIRNGINAKNGNVLDTYDNDWNNPVVVTSTTVEQAGAPNTKNALNELSSLVGRTVGNGQCYAVSAWFSNKLGGAGLGAGIGGFSGLVGSGIRACDIGTDYNWGSFGWGVEGSGFSGANIVAGTILNIKPNYGAPWYTGYYGHTVVVESVNGDTVTVLQQNYAGKQYVTRDKYSMNAIIPSIQTLVKPPELAKGGRVDGGNAVVKVDGVDRYVNVDLPTDVKTTEETEEFYIPHSYNNKWYDENGNLEFYISGSAIRAPQSADNFPVAFSSRDSNDRWIRRDFEYEVDSVEELIEKSLEDLKKSCYPTLDYEVDGFFEASIGDTYLIEDDDFEPKLTIKARVISQEISHTIPENNKTTLSNYIKLKSAVPDALASRLQQLIDASIPYEIRVSSSNGTSFKNNEGKSEITVELLRSGIVQDAEFLFKNGDSIVGKGKTLLVKATDFENVFNLTIEAYVNNSLVAAKPLTFTDVEDGEQGPQGPQGEQGPQGPKGDKGEDGIAGKDGVGLKSTVVTYGLSTSETTQPSSWTAQVPTLTKGNYLWTKTVWTYTDNTSETGYQKTYIAKDGNDGADGIAGKDGVGIESTTITYASSTSGITKPSSGWTSTIPSVPAGNYLWTKTVWTYTDGTSETGYSVAKMGEMGAKGEKGDPGNDGLPGAPGVGIKSTTSTYGLSSNETTQPTNWTTTVPSLVKGQYLWTKNVWTYTDGRTETGYTKTYIPKDGNDGTNGIAGKDGVGISSTTITYASSSSGTTAPTSGWTASVPNVSPGQYLWTKTVWTYTDNTNETGYSVARMGLNGSQGPQGLQGLQGPKGDIGIQGPKGADGKSSYTHIAYAFNIIEGMETIPETAITGQWDTTFVTYPDPAPFGDSETVKNLIQVTSGQVLYLLKISSNTEYFRYNWYDSNMVFLSRAYTNAMETKVVVPSNATYLWISIPSNANASILSETSFSMQGTGNDTHIGMYVDNIPTDSNDITKYNWTLIKGADGAQGVAGAKGADGRTPYFHIAYATNATGTQGFSTTDSNGKTYIGQYTDYTQADSTDPTKYKWTLIKGEKGDQGIQGIQGPKGDQGIPGVKGADGKTQYTHIAYADNETGGGFSQTDQNKAYIGMYVDFTETDSNDPTKYRWTKWKGSDGAQGVPGPKGADGKTPYIHFAYADDANGTNFSLTDKNQQYQGYYSDYTEADSTDYTKYKWVDRLANVQVGGRNLIIRSQIQNGFIDNTGNLVSSNDYFTTGFIDAKNNKKFTISAPKNEGGLLALFRLIKYDADKNFMGRDIISYTQNIKTIKTINLTNDVSYFKVSFDGIYGEPFKIESGNVATDYSLAPEDMQEQIDSKADQALTQDQLNALKEQSELHQKELDAKADLDTIEKWYKEYLDYVNINNDNREKSEAALLAISERVASIVNDLGETKERWNFIDTYMDVADEGLVIGKQDGSTNIKISNDRISMFSNGDEVMWISQNMLHIANGVFVQTLQIGNFRFESLDSNGEILGLRYLGG